MLQRSLALRLAFRPRVGDALPLSKHRNRVSMPNAISGPMQQTMSPYNIEADKAISPAADRNKQPIVEALRPHLPADGQVLELASGSGQHAAYLAASFPNLTFQPTDLTNELFHSISAYGHGLKNVLPPVTLDATAPPEAWLNCNGKALDLGAVLCINMAHISPWQATQGLLCGAGFHLSSGRKLFMYGPFKVRGQHISDSNAGFDVSLRGRDASWGVRDTAEVEQAAALHGLSIVETIQMPANNLILVLVKA